MAIAISYGIGSVLGSLVDNGLANVLSLQTLEHGTNAINYLGIRIFGGNPNHGGKATGSTEILYGSDGNMLEKTRGYFFLAKDYLEKEWMDEVDFWRRPIAPLCLWVIPRLHCVLSAYALVNPKWNKIARVALGTLAATFHLLFVPSLRFRFRSQEIQDFLKQNIMESDKNYSQLAFKISQTVAAYRIGLLGTLAVGVNCNWFSRATEDPLRILKGVVQLTTALALTAFLLQTAFFCSYSMVIPLAIGVALN